MLAVRQAGKFREPVLLRWGLVPSWAKDVKSGPPLINARAETLRDKPAFRTAFAKRRCLIPADGFYEWKTGEGKTKQPFHIRMANERPFAFAGLWECWRPDASAPALVPSAPPVESCTIVTTTANSKLAELHERMPVILQEEDYDRWLDPAVTDPKELQSLLVPYPAEEMAFGPVTPFVNSARNDGPQCVETAAPQSTLIR